MNINPIFIVLNLIFAGATWVTYDDAGDLWWALPLSLWVGYLLFAAWVDGENARRTQKRRTWR